MSNRDEQSIRAAGEQVFENYLALLGIKDFGFEEEVEGTTRRPDYRINIEGEPARFDVKQFDPQPEDLPNGFGCYSPYPPLREKINAARLKFKGLKGTASCSLVLYNNGKPLVMLSPLPVYGAMLGDVGLTFPIDTRTGIGDAARMKQAFLGGGKMIRYAKGGKEPIAPQNTTISAIVALGVVRVGQCRFDVAVSTRRRALGRDLSQEEWWSMLDEWNAATPGLGEYALRARIYENPFAVKPLSRTFGRGPWDVRFGPEGDSLVRLYVGPELARLEDDEKAAGIQVNPWKWDG